MHALRSGLAALAGAVHVLAEPDDAVPRESRRRVEGLLVGEIERLQRLVAVDPLGSGAVVLELDDVVGQVLLTRRMAGQSVQWRPSGIRVSVARDALVEVLNILLTNAAQHAPGAPVALAAQWDGSSVRIVVTDDGPGVPRELAPVIFQRGARGPGSRGEGLGLAMASELAESLGGSLRLRHVRGHGARFELRLPLAAELDGVA